MNLFCKIVFFQFIKTKLEVMKKISIIWHISKDLFENADRENALFLNEN